jgi:hypothetical protein
LYSPEYKILQIEFLHVCGINHWLQHDFFLNFFGTHKYDFLIFESSKSTGAQEQKKKTLCPVAESFFCVSGGYWMALPSLRFLICVVVINALRISFFASRLTKPETEP